MNTNNQWTRISLFYNKSDYNILFKRGLAPFLKKQQEEHLETDYWLFLDSCQGDHINVVLKTVSIDGKRLERCINKHLIKFLYSNTSYTEPEKFPSSYLFKKYPNNSIQYNIFKQPSLISSHKMESYLRHSVSRSMIQSLSEEKVDSETIFTVVTNMQMIFINETAGENAIKQIKILYDKEFKKIQNIILASSVDSLVSNILKNNYLTLKSISKYIYNRDYNEYWMQEWQMTCQNVFSSIDSFDEKYIFLNDILFEHFGIKSKKRLFFSLALNKAILQEFYKPNNHLKPEL